ncbi:carbohydrate kinase family protein [Actinomadura montaniterrae]|uniref:Carbohydrate kinase family protein n=1 Tax=Actinomadura montaniterrae TaxID=1803903 RepID=A0A6L3VJD1_9ACTN|nr:carbohydrate kinase family protein [Actinomadura montaniterrae]KAB2366702.1 carbohydrate kinase family protein [Actinomadura montaniterrae]
MLDLLVVGDANPDVLVHGAPDVPPYGQAETLVGGGVLALGGSAAIAAHGAARLGLATAFAGLVGRDAAGDFVLDALSGAGVNVSWVVRHDALPTALTVCLNRPGGDRAILTASGCLAEFGPEHVPDVAARHVHAASYFLQPRLAKALPAVLRGHRASGATTSLDTNDDPSGRWELAPGLLAECTFLLPNEAEALALSDRDTLPDALAALAGAGCVPVVKRGGQGADALRDGKVVHADAPRADPVDTVGAGDSFDAGFLAGWLDRGDLAHALALGAVCGALSTRAVGGTAGQPTLAEALAQIA